MYIMRLAFEELHCGLYLYLSGQFCGVPYMYVQNSFTSSVVVVWAVDLTVSSMASELVKCYSITRRFLHV